uniref:Uncharacterized protein n=1 Tax=Anopheles culicifacies TaxID=139723 RepID=A0A182MBD5_9DIPT
MNVCAELVISSRCCLLRPASVSSGSFSHGSSKPGPFSRIDEDIASMTRRKHSPGVRTSPADEMIFSSSNSIACTMDREDRTAFNVKSVADSRLVAFTHPLTYVTPDGYPLAQVAHYAHNHYTRLQSRCSSLRSHAPTNAQDYNKDSGEEKENFNLVPIFRNTSSNVVIHGAQGSTFRWFEMHGMDAPAANAHDGERMKIQTITLLYTNIYTYIVIEGGVVSRGEEK